MARECWKRRQTVSEVHQRSPRVLSWVWFLSFLPLCGGGNVALRSGAGMRKVTQDSLPARAYCKIWKDKEDSWVFHTFPTIPGRGACVHFFQRSEAFVAPTTVGRTRARLLNLLSRLSCPTRLHRAHQASQGQCPPRLSTNTAQREDSLSSSWPSTFPAHIFVLRYHPWGHLSLSSLDVYTTVPRHGPGYSSPSYRVFPKAPSALPP